MLLVEEATRSVTSLAVATRLTRDHEDVEKDVAKAKAKKGIQKQIRRRKRR